MQMRAYTTEGFQRISTNRYANGVVQFAHVLQRFLGDRSFRMRAELKELQPLVFKPGKIT